jgi:hypothetical protein
MSNLSPRKVISLAVLLPFIIVQFALSSPPVSAQGETPLSFTLITYLFTPPKRLG